MTCTYPRCLRNFSALLALLLFSPAGFGQSNLADRHPDVVAGLQGAIQARESGDVPRAIRILENLGEQYPQSFKVWETLGWTYWDAGRQEDAIELWESVKLIMPGDPRVINMLAKAYTAQNDLERAVEMRRQQVQLDDSKEARFELARSLRWQARLDEAIIELERLYKQQPNRMDLRYELGRAYLSSKQYDKAIGHWVALVDASPNELDYRRSLGECLIHTGSLDDGLMVLETVLNHRPNDQDAARMIADAKLFNQADGGVSSLPAIRRVINTTDHIAVKQKLRTRAIDLLVRLWKANPDRYTLDEAIEHATHYVEDDDMSVDGWLALAELYLMIRRFDVSIRLFEETMSSFNPNNIRAQRGVFEAYLADGQFKKAATYLGKIEDFNPKDPYLHYYRLRYNMGRGHFDEALKDSEKLEAAGEDAVACLLYHGLTPSEYSEIHSADQLIEHVETLKKHGFNVVHPSRLKQMRGQSSGLSPMTRPGLTRPGSAKAAKRNVVITFDDARLDSMMFGTEVAEQLGEAFTMTVPVGSILNKNYFIADFPQLRSFNENNQWIYGSHLLYCSDHIPVDAYGTKGHSLNNRMWIAEQNRLESMSEYRKRVEDEYKVSRQYMENEFSGPGLDASIVAYPFGNIGQEGRSNVDGAVAYNKGLAQRYYDMGFIQSVFGHAVAGDNPLLYQRYSVKREDSGEDLAMHLIRHHPVNLARELRVKLATLMGNYYLAREVVAELKDEGYPPQLLVGLEDYRHDRLAQKFWAPVRVEDSKEAWYKPKLDDPSVEADVRYFQDAESRENLQFMTGIGAKLTPNIKAGIRVGAGTLSQGPVFDENEVQFTRFTNESLQVGRDVSETDVGAYGTFTFANQDYIGLDIMNRAFSGDASGSETYTRIMGKWTPWTPLELVGRRIHDIEPSALTIDEGLTYDLTQLDAVYRVTDEIDFWSNVRQYDYSDGNSRQHLMLRGTYLIEPESGLHLGGRYQFTDSDFERPEYWTPTDLHRVYGEVNWRKHQDRLYYNLLLRLGVGREGVSEEEQDRYDELVARAIAEDFDPEVDEPKEEWIYIYGASASSRYKVTKKFEINGELSYFRLPRYWESRAGLGLRYEW